MCDPQGRLLVLNLAGGGLSCPAFPAALSRLSQLQSLDLGHNSIKDTAAGAAQVSRVCLAGCLGAGDRLDSDGEACG